MSDLSGLIIRNAEAEDEAQILELLNLALGSGSTPRTIDFWRWKHLRNPFGRSPVLVALADDRVVGLRAFLHWRWRLGERSLTAVRPVDTAVHPDWRRRGLFSHLTRTLIERVTSEGCELVFNTPNRRSGAGYRKLGWKAAAKPSLFVRARRPLRMAAAALGAGRRRAAADISHYPPASEWLARPDVPELLDNGPDEQGERLTTARNLDYLGWRYKEIPALDYRTLGQADSGTRVAIVFRSRLRRGIRELLITEVLGSGSATQRARLLKELVERLNSENEIDYVLAGAARSSSDGFVLARAGFRQIPWGPSMMVRCLIDDPPLSRLVTRDSWQLSAGDLEIF